MNRTHDTLVVVLLARPAWAPPGIATGAWRAALAEDVVDLVAGLAQTDAAIAVPAADRDLAAAIGWPSMPVYELSRADAMEPAMEPAAGALAEALAAAHAAGYPRAAILAADAPDLPGLLVGKLLRPLSTRPVALAEATGGGLLGLASRLPPPPWLPADLDLDAPGAADRVRAAAPRRALVGEAPTWHRLRGPADLGRLDPGLEGWDATRALLSGG